MDNHPWKLVGPWYRTHSVGGAVPNQAIQNQAVQNRNSAPVIQKYASSDFSEAMVAEPQHSLRFNSEDFMQRLALDPNQIITHPEYVKRQSPLKLFLDMHSRFYVVVCELHCDVAGFPSVERDQVCEAGFVIRRQVPAIEDAFKQEITELLSERKQVSEQLDLAKLKLNNALETLEAAKNGTDQGIVAAITTTISQGSAKLAIDSQQASAVNLQSKYDTLMGDLNAHAAANNVSMQQQAWIPTELKGVGNWQTLDEDPSDTIEQVFPLYPLIADPTEDGHSAKGKSIWFGVIPTASADTDSLGQPKFDEADVYQAHCFVRRHKPQFPQKQNQKDCCGELIWSLATEQYQLASPFDLDGTSHRPINIKMPDLNALKNQANASPPGRGASAKLIAPEDSSLNFKTDSMDMPEGGSPVTRAGQQICFFSILLFFIVALFLFRLFLPILLFIFNLWFLLKLKFCIPPSIEFSAGLVADLNFSGSFGADFDASIEADIQLMKDFGADLAIQINKEGPNLQAKFAQPGYQLTVNKNKANEKTYSTESELKNDLSLLLTNGINASDDMRAQMQNGGAGEGLNAGLELDEMASIYASTQAQYENVTHPELAAELPTPEMGLVYFSKIAMPKSSQKETA